MTLQEMEEFFNDFNEQNGYNNKIRVINFDKDTNFTEFELVYEDHTLGNLLFTQLEKDNRVLNSCYKIPHPTSNTMTLQLSAKQGEDIKTILIESIDTLISESEETVRVFDSLIESS